MRLVPFSCRETLVILTPLSQNSKGCWYGNVEHSVLYSHHHIFIQCILKVTDIQSCNMFACCGPELPKYFTLVPIGACQSLYTYWQYFHLRWSTIFRKVFMLNNTCNVTLPMLSNLLQQVLYRNLRNIFICVLYKYLAMHWRSFVYDHGQGKR